MSELKLLPHTTLWQPPVEGNVEISQISRDKIVGYASGHKQSFHTHTNMHASTYTEKWKHFYLQYEL